MHAEAFVLTVAGQPLSRRSISIASPAAGEAIVEVEACGLCHTDLGFASGVVAPKHALPLVLGHEIVGKVVAAGGSYETLVGRKVLVPAVMGCGTCAYCKAGRGNACPAQKMPGNDIDGGFASHVLVPASPLVPIDDAPGKIDTRELAVVADAVSTAYQAIRRATLVKGDAAFVVGAGGVGGYAIQIARAMGARVVACDVSADKLALVRVHGAEHTIDVAGRAPKDVRKEIHALAREWGIPSLAHRIFECSGTTEGQLLAYALLGPAAVMVQVGYTTKPVELRLSNLMAFDATVHGTWGCPHEAYPDVLRMIYAGQVALHPFVEHAPMSRINEIFDDMAHHRLAKRVVFDPRT
ncbi:MAG: 6-hydroxycyclohex-1-ene-1-carbonyl-CoA dehydrogenase [Acidobacteriota bacterium]